MKNKNLLIVPGLLLNFILFSVITSLGREKSDMAVLVAVLLIVGALYGNYFLIKYITKNQTTK